LSPRNGRSTHHASATAARAERDGLLRQGLSDPRCRPGYSWHRSDWRWLVCRKPRHQHVYRNRAGSNPDAAGDAHGITAGESKIGLAEFTADDINALLQNEPEFHEARNHARVAIANSIVSLDVSAPLHSAQWSRLKGRWFNGNIQFGFSYVDDNFNFDVRSAEANGYQFPRALLSGELMQSFNRSFNDSFRRESARRGDASDLWRHIRMATVQNDKLIVTTGAL